MAVWWRFRDYVTPAGVNPVAVWYCAQDGQVKTWFNSTVKILTVMEEWFDPPSRWARRLHGRHEGLIEIPFDISVPGPAGKPIKRRFRPVGVLREEIGDFVLLLGCEKAYRGGIYIPDGAFDIALGYKADLERGIGHVCDHLTF